MRSKYFASRGSTLSCITKTLFGALQSHWPPRPTKCRPQAGSNDNEGTRTRR